MSRAELPRSEHQEQIKQLAAMRAFLLENVTMNIKELRQRRADLKAELDTVLASVDAKAGLTVEQRAKIDSLKAQNAANDELITLCEEQMERERNLPTASSAVVVKENVEDDPKGGFTDHKDYLKAVMDSGTGRRIDKRLLRFRATAGSDEQGAYADPYGGYLIPVSVAPGVLSLRPEDDPLSALITNIPMTAPVVKINARVDKTHTTSVSGGLTVTRRPETVDGTSSRMQFEPIELNAHELFGLAYATETILTDSPESFVALLSAGFRDEFQSKAMAERINGTGVGEPKGAMKSGCLITVSAETGQASSTIITENIDKMAARCWRYGQSVWLANHSTRPQLRGLVRAVGTGGSVVPYFDANPDGAETLDGRPIYFTEECAALGSLGDILLGVWSEYLEGLYQPLQQAESIHVRFIANERAFKFWLRNDGQPWWRAALTPKNGDTLSPFVTLAAR